jgi:parallel beta-helix repeat protein
MDLKRTTQVMAIVGIYAIVSLSSLVTVPEEVSGYSPHDPIYIDGNGQFTPANGVTGGVGTPSDPYVIEGWEINASFGHGIEIRNTDVHFIILNVYVHSGWGGGFPCYHGIFLRNLTNGRVDNVTATGNFYGIFLEKSSGNTLANITASFNVADGVRLYLSAGNFIIDTNISFNNNGVALEASQRNVLTGNVMYENGVYLRGPNLEHWNTHSMDTSNVVNDKPLYYWKNISGGSIPLGAGQVILANCTNVIVENQNILNSSDAIHLGFSSDNVVANNTVSSPKGDGIRLYSSHNSTIKTNIASFSGGEGIELVSSNGSIVTDNILDSNGWHGIYLRYSDNSKIDNNTVLGSGWGIYLLYSNHTNMSNNEAHGHRWDGIRLWYSENANIDGNVAHDNFAGIALGESGYNNISNNTFHSNSIYGINCENSNRNNFVNNTILSNDEFGLYFFLAEINYIYHNSFVDNAKQVHEVQMAFNNRWDNGYPSGGNYWSDYTGADQFWGPNQDMLGSDGIGDTPYVMHVGSQDRYPLMHPFGTVFVRSPEGFDASLSGLNLENVTLNWSLSPDDGAGFKFVTGYKIFRNLTYDPKGSGYQLVALVPNGTNTFVDNFAGEGEPNNYFYQLCAIDLRNNTTCADNQAGKFTRALSEGNCIVSAPLIQSDESVETVLQTVAFDKAWTYDSFSSEWNSYMTSKPYGGDFVSINHTMGVWARVIDDCNLTVAGIVPRHTTIQLHAGWNLVGFPSFKQDYTVGDLKTILPIDRVEGFDASSPPYYLKLLQDSDVLQAGQAYWLRVSGDAIWTLSSA